MDWLLNFINSFFSKLWHLVKLGLDAVFHAISLFLFMIFDGFCVVVTSFISALDLSALAFTQYAEWTNLPPQAIYIINQLALPQCASLIAGAILVRMILNLIPAALTRV